MQRCTNVTQTNTCIVNSFVLICNHSQLQCKIARVSLSCYIQKPLSAPFTNQVNLQCGRPPHAKRGEYGRGICIWGTIGTHLFQSAVQSCHLGIQKKQHLLTANTMYLVCFIRNFQGSKTIASSSTITFRLPPGFGMTRHASQEDTKTALNHDK